MAAADHPASAGRKELQEDAEKRRLERARLQSRHKRPAFYAALANYRGNLHASTSTFFQPLQPGDHISNLTCESRN